MTKNQNPAVKAALFSVNGCAPIYSGFGVYLVCSQFIGQKCISLEVILHTSFKIPDAQGANIVGLLLRNPSVNWPARQAADFRFTMPSGTARRDFWDWLKRMDRVK